MALPKNFQFSQSSLQDYLDCQRRFQLRYLQRRTWPAVEAEPALQNELTLQRGAQFHQLVHQYLAGVPAEKLTRSVEADETLSRWWGNFSSQAVLHETGYKRYPEISLSAPLGDHRLVAKYDTLAVKQPGAQGSAGPIHAKIYDWKTSRQRPKRTWLADRLQTRVYPYLLVRAGAQVNDGQPIPAGQIEMIYWFSNFPDQPARFPYSQDQFETDERYLRGLIQQIKAMGAETAPLTEELSRCRFCVYRSLCDRGVKAGPLEEMNDFSEAQPGFDLELDFDQIAEIEY
jgi:CRISPR/Cas system-associated exonuclease Cas4 (RecB family)